MWNIILLTALFVAVATVYHFRRPLIAKLKQFDSRNAARKAEELYERRDRFAHYRRAVLTAEEGLEEVREIAVNDPRTGERVTRFQFLGDEFATRDEATRARRLRAVEIAREFYAELDGATIARHPPAHRPVPPAGLPAPDDRATPPRPS